MPKAKNSEGKESATLAGMRDVLLPKLLSDELRVPKLKSETHALQSHTSS